jgi:hypothetical protein
MSKRVGSLKVALVVGILALYITVLVRGTTESTRRVLQLRDETPARDRVAVSVLVTSRRADNLISVAILINAMMIGLAISVLAMVLPLERQAGSGILCRYHCFCR